MKPSTWNLYSQMQTLGPKFQLRRIEAWRLAKRPPYCTLSVYACGIDEHACMGCTEETCETGRIVGQVVRGVSGADEGCCLDWWTSTRITDSPLTSTQKTSLAAAGCPSMIDRALGLRCILRLCASGGLAPMTLCRAWSPT